MTKRFLPFICVMIALTLAAAPLAAASAALPEGYVYEPWRGDKGGVIAEEISRLNDRGLADTAVIMALPPSWQQTAGEAGIMGKSAILWHKTYAVIDAVVNNMERSFTRFFVLNYFITEEGGVALLFYEDGSTEWVMMPEADVNALWGCCGVFSSKNGQPTVNTGTAAALTPPLKYGLLDENLTVKIDGEEITYPKGIIIPIGYDEDNKPFLRLPNGTKIPLTDAKFTEITSPYTPPEPVHNASTSSDDDKKVGGAPDCGCPNCYPSGCSLCNNPTPGCPCYCCTNPQP